MNVNSKPYKYHNKELKHDSRGIIKEKTKHTKPRLPNRATFYCYSRNLTVLATATV